jgi:predicted dehydrogenase
MENKMKKKFGIGIIGLGNIADIHAQAIIEAENAELISAYSRNENKARSFAEKYNITGFSEWDKFIHDPNLDAVVICTPNGTHLDLGKSAAEAKKHLIIEKPIEVTLERAQELINISRKNNVELAVIYQSRFMDEIIKAKSIIDENQLGRLIMADAYVKWFRSQDYYDSGEWRGTISLDGGGVLINQAIHTIDLLQWFMGDVQSVFGQTATFTHRMEGEDNAVAALRFKNGAIGVIEASTSIQPAQARRLEIHGEKGTIIIDDDKVNIFIEGKTEKEDSSQNGKNEPSGSTSPLAGFSIIPHKNQIEQIVKDINNGKTPTVSGADSMKSLAIVLAVYESAGIGKNIILDDFIKQKIK